MVGGDCDWVVGAFKVVSPCGTGGLDRQELFVADIVTTFNRVQGSGVEATGMEDNSGIGLGQDGADGEVAGVGFEDERLRGVSMGEDWCSSESCLQRGECGFVFLSP